MRRFEAEQEGDEYHFTDDENFDDLDDDELIEDSEGSLASKIKQFILPAVVGVLFVGYAGYKLVGLFSAPAVPQGAQRNLVSATEFSAPVQTPPPSQQPATETNAFSQQNIASGATAIIGTIDTPDVDTQKSAFRSDDLDNFLSDYKEELKQMQNKLNAHVDRRVTVIAKQGISQEKSLAAIMQGLGQIGSALTHLNESLQKSAEEIKTQTAMQQRVIQHLQSTQVLGSQNAAAVPADFVPRHHRDAAPQQKTASSSYYIQAIIPGRAWIKTSDGHVVTVVRGNSIPGYGRVLRIDSDRGTVVMSSGRIIRFGIEQG